MKKNNKQGAGSKQQVEKRVRELMERVTVGLDVGDQWTYFCVLEGVAEVVARGRVRTRKTELESLLRRFPAAEVGMETGTHCGWISRVVADGGHEPVVGHAREMKKHYPGERKNDVKDAEAIARLLRSDRKMFHPVKLRTAEEQADLAVVRGRAALVEARTELVNALRSLSKNLGVPLPKCSTGAFVRRVEALLPEALRPAAAPMLAVIEKLNEQIAQADRQVRELSMGKYAHPTTSLKQVAGVSDLTALTYRLTIWDPKRFQRGRDVGVYLGLAPGLERSGESEREKRISRAGNRYLRKLLVQAGHYILGPFGPDSDLRRFGQRLAAAGGGSARAKKRAVVAVARKLAVLLHRLWYGEVYEPRRGVRAAGAA